MLPKTKIINKTSKERDLRVLTNILNGVKFTNEAKSLGVSASAVREIFHRQIKRAIPDLYGKNVHGFFDGKVPKIKQLISIRAEIHKAVSARLRVAPPQTKNFNPLVDLKLSCTCGENGCDKRSTKQMLLNMLQKVRYDYGLPMIVTSGGRCPLHKNEKHRSVPADHQKAMGVDIRITGLSMGAKLAAIAGKYGFNAIAINLELGFIHLGYRPENNKIVTWEY